MTLQNFTDIVKHAPELAKRLLKEPRVIASIDRDVQQTFDIKLIPNTYALRRVDNVKFFLSQLEYTLDNINNDVKYLNSDLQQTIKYLRFEFCKRRVETWTKQPSHTPTSGRGLFDGYVRQLRAKIPEIEQLMQNCLDKPTTQQSKQVRFKRG